MGNEAVFRNDLLSILIILGIFQGAFLAFFFLRKSSGNKKSNVYLGIILILFAFHNLDFWASYSRYVIKMPFIFDISVPFAFAMGPLFYQYIRTLIKDTADKNLIWHYIPFAFFFVYSFFFLIQPDDFKYNVFISSRNIDLPLKEVTLNHSFDPLGLRSRIDFLIPVQLCIYLLLSYYVFVKHLAEKSINILTP
ncbi:MAG: hypothetical protein WAL29_18170, partial [Bacteroidales bacterium]